MNYNFTDGTRNVLALAREEAIRLQHDYVGTEHILLGVLRKPEETGAVLLERMGVDAAATRRMLEETVRVGKAMITRGELPYTSRAKKTLEYAMAETRQLKDDFVGTEHLVLGLLREEKGIAAAVLTALGVSLESAREALFRLRNGQPESEPRNDARSRSREEPVWFLEVDATSETPIYEQIIARIEEAVATGKLAVGERLPSVRQLAEELGIAPGTVARAYSELETRGILETEGARGTRVSKSAAERRPPDADHVTALEGLLRPVVVAAYHMGATAKQLVTALERAMKGIFGL